MANDDGGDDQRTVTVKADEYDKLTRSAMLQELKEELEKWSKARFRVVLTVVAVAGFVGIQAIGFVVIDQTLGSKIDEASAAAVRLEVTEAHVTAESAEAIRETRAATKDALLALVELSGRADDLDARFIAIAAKANAASENVRAEADLLVEGLQDQLNRLAENVDLELAVVRQSLTEAVAAPATNLSTQQTAIRRTFELEKIAPFKGRSPIEVPIIFSASADPKVADAAVATLRKLGYRSSVQIVKFVGRVEVPTLLINPLTATELLPENRTVT